MTLAEFGVAAGKAYSQGGEIANLLVVAQVRVAMEQEKAAQAGLQTALWTKRLAIATFALAAATVILAIVTVVAS